MTRGRRRASHRVLAYAVAAVVLAMPGPRIIPRAVGEVRVYRIPMGGYYADARGRLYWYSRGGYMALWCDASQEAGGAAATGRRATRTPIRRI